FLQASGMLATRAVMSPVISQNRANIPPAMLDVESLEKFVDPLPIPPNISPSGVRPNPGNPNSKIPYYRLRMRQLDVKLHRDLRPARVWGFGDSSPGPTFETKSGQGLMVEWVNELPKEHFLPIDHSIHGAEADKPDVRVVPHLHGA